MGSSFVESFRREESSFGIKNDEAHHGNELTRSGKKRSLAKEFKVQIKS